MFMCASLEPEIGLQAFAAYALDGIVHAPASAARSDFHPIHSDREVRLGKHVGDVSDSPRMLACERQ
jgi:hypothetical protein